MALTLYDNLTTIKNKLSIARRVYKRHITAQR